MDKAIQTFERVVIEAVSAFAPWLAPLIPAYLVYSNMIGILMLPEWVALVGAITVECLGLASVNTAVMFWRYNDSKRQIDQSAPMWVALAVGGFYIVVVLTINAILQIWPDNLGVIVLSDALLSLLSVDAGVILAIRSQHARRLDQIAKDKEEQREHRRELREIAAQKAQEEAQLRATEAQETQLREIAAQKAKSIDRIAFLALVDENQSSSIAELARKHGVNERTAQYWVSVNGNGHHSK